MATRLGRSLALRDRALVAEGGLAAFVRLAWPSVDPAPLRWNWHHDIICDRLERVTSGEIRQLCINVPPGTTKTLISSVLWPAWQWIVDPTHKLIAASYGDICLDAARQHRDLVQGEWFQARWPGVKIPFQNTRAASFFKNDRGGLRFSTSVGGPMTGHHALTLLADDLNKAQDAMGGAGYTMVRLDASWDCWSKVMVTRRTDPAKVRRVYVGQRLHDRDVPGRWQEKDGDAIEMVCLPMRYDPNHPHVCPDDPRREPGELLWPEHIPEETVRELEDALGPRDAAAQLQQRPVPEGGAVFRREWFRFYRTDHLGRLTKGAHLRACQHWDLNVEETATGSFVSGGVYLSDGTDAYRVDARRGRWEFTTAADQIVEMTLDWPDSGRECVIEGKANGPAMKSFLERYYREECKRRGIAHPPELNVVLYQPRGSKLARANGVTGIVRSGHFWLPEDAVWLGSYLDELLRFTGRGGETDDQVDETSQALTYLYGSQSQRWADAMQQARRYLREGKGRAA